MELTRDNILWFAGLFEGEGCLCCCKPKDKKTKRWSMMLKMTDHDVVNKIESMFGGKLYFKKISLINPKHKDNTTWQTGDHKKIYALCAAMYSFMGERRKLKMEEFIKDFASRPINKSEATKLLWNDPEWRANQLADRKARIGKSRGLTKAQYMT